MFLCAMLNLLTVIYSAPPDRCHWKKVYLCPSTVLSLCVFALAFYKWWATPCKDYPPGVRGFPVFGALPYFSKYPEKDIARWSKGKYGPVLFVRFGMSDIVIINEYDLVKEAFLAKSSKYLDRPSVPLVEQVTRGLGIGFRSSTASWRIQRNFLKLKLNNLHEGKDDNETRMRKNVQTLVEAIKNVKEVPFDISNLLLCTVCNNISNFVFGRSFEFDDKRFLEFVHALYNVFADPKTSFQVRLVMLFPTLQYVPPFKHASGVFQSRYNLMLAFIDQEIKRHKENVEGVKDYVDAFRKEQSSRKGADEFHDEQLRMAILDNFIAGTDTFSGVILWGLLCFLHYPSIQKKLYDEISYAFGEESDISLKDTDSLPYTLAFIQELLRFRTPVPLGLQHLTTDKTKLYGYSLPKCTKVMANVWAIHNDPNLWENPHLFQPERHIHEDGHFIYSKKIIPFLIGGRSCPGEKFARLQAFLLITNLVRNFEFLPDPNDTDLPTILGGTGGIMLGPHHFKFVAKIR